MKISYFLDNKTEPMFVRTRNKEVRFDGVNQDGGIKSTLVEYDGTETTITGYDRFVITAEKVEISE